MICSDHELEGTQQRIATFQKILAQLRITATPEEFPYVASGYKAEIEKMQAFQMRVGRIADAPGPVQWLLANAVIPIASKLQGQGMLRELQRGTTAVKMDFPVRIP